MIYLKKFKSLIKWFVKWVFFYLQRTLRIKYVSFHHFPFPISEVRLHEDDAILLHDMCNILKQSDLHFRVTDGTALGLYRNECFIGHDNDLDFDILEIHNEKKLLKTMYKRGFKIGRLVYYNGCISQVVFYNNRRQIVDFANWVVANDKICQYEEPGYIRIQDLKYFTCLNNINAYGFSFPIAGYTEEWMEMRYGKEWRTPKTYKGDWKDECGDLIKL